jgi:hypothetical protein
MEMDKDKEDTEEIVLKKEDLNHCKALENLVTPVCSIPKLAFIDVILRYNIFNGILYYGLDNLQNFLFRSAAMLSKTDKKPIVNFLLVHNFVPQLVAIYRY